MFNRRNFMSGMAAGLVGIKWGVRGFFDQVRYVMQSPAELKPFSIGKRYLYFGTTGYYGLINNPATAQGGGSSAGEVRTTVHGRWTGACRTSPAPHPPPCASRDC